MEKSSKTFNAKRYKHVRKQGKMKRPFLQHPKKAAKAKKDQRRVEVDRKPKKKKKKHGHTNVMRDESGNGGIENVKW